MSRAAGYKLGWKVLRCQSINILLLTYKATPKIPIFFALQAKEEGSIKSWNECKEGLILLYFSAHSLTQLLLLFLCYRTVTSKQNSIKAILGIKTIKCISKYVCTFWGSKPDVIKVPLQKHAFSSNLDIQGFAQKWIALLGYQGFLHCISNEN